MPAVITNKFRIHNAEQFKEALDEPANTILYFYVAGATPYADEANPFSPGTAVSNTEVYPWRDMYAVKRIQSSDVSHTTLRHDWQSGETYTRYDDQTTNILTDKFYVITDEYNVYKCLNANNTPFNPSGTPSTVKPTGTPAETNISTADGYVWKYMYSVTTSDALKFLTASHIPVKRLTSDDGSNQWLVQQSAIPGGIDSVSLTSGGSGYLTAPTVTIAGDGTGATATASLNAGLVNNITITNKGTGYTQATISFSGGGPGNGNPTANAVAKVIISPKGGHGSDPVKELGGIYLLIDVRLDGNEANTFATVNDFRKIGIIRDPLVYGATNSTQKATSLVYRQTFRYTLGSVTGTTFMLDEGVTSGANSANVIQYSTGATTYLYTTLPTPKKFALGNVISNSNAAPTSATITAIDNPGLEPYSGEIIYMENRVAVNRASDQIEDIKLIVEF